MATRSTHVHGQALPERRDVHRVIVPLGLALGLLLAYASSPSARAGNTAFRCRGATGIQVQSLDLETRSELAVDFFGQLGDSTPVRLLDAVLDPGRASNIYVPGVPGLQPGVFSALAVSESPTSAIVRTDWPCSGGAALYSSVQGANEIALPLVTAGYTSLRSLITVQNVGGVIGEPATVELLFHDHEDGELVFRRSVEILGGMSETIDIWSDYPEPGQLSFRGSLRLRSDVEIGAMAFSAFEVRSGVEAMAVYAYEAQPLDAAASRLLAPLIRRRFYDFDTGIVVLNPGTTQVDVTATYRGTLGDCDGMTISHGPISIPPGGVGDIYQGPDPENGLPDQCVGSAVIEAEGGDVLAFVLDTEDFGLQAAAYNAVSEDHASTLHALPLVRRAHTKSMRMTTGVQVMNASPSETASVSLELFDSSGSPIEGCGSGCRARIPPLESGTFYPGANGLLALPSGSYGSALVRSDQAVTVIVQDASELGTIDASTYSAIPLGVEDQESVARIPYAER